MGNVIDDADSSPVSYKENLQGHGFRHRDALRLLFILTVGSEAVDKCQVGAEDATHVFRSEKRVMAIDFLIRYPDYLADALLDLFEMTQDNNLLNIVKEIFDTNEPSLRLIKMVRWNFGAYQSIETSLSILNAYGLVYPMKLVADGVARRYDFYIYPKAFNFLEHAVQTVPELSWYRDRVALAMKIANSKSGSKLKEWQYEHKAYSDTPHGCVIPSIQGVVRQRLENFMDNQL